MSLESESISGLDEHDEHINGGPRSIPIGYSCELASFVFYFMRSYSCLGPQRFGAVCEVTYIKITLRPLSICNLVSREVQIN